MKKQATKRGRGRPPINQGEVMIQLAIRFPPPMIEAIDAIRADRLDCPDRAVIIRELVARALEDGKKRRR
jgi:hypothetical protein